MYNEKNFEYIEIKGGENMHRYIKFCEDDVNYVEIIKSIVNDFDSYQYISNKLNIILQEIEDDIDYVDFSDDMYKTIQITLNDDIVYAFDYDNKNYPLLSFNCNKIVLSYVDTTISFDDIIIDLSRFEFKTFDRIE